MKGIVGRSVLLLATCLSVAFAAPSDQKPDPQGTAPKKSAPKAKSNRTAPQSLTGCVDEQEGKYVLLDERMLNKLANLEAGAAGDENVFAKHVGHKVIVKGIKPSDPDGSFKVTSIEELATVCAPPQGASPQ